MTPSTLLRIELTLLAVPGHPHPGTVNSTIRSAAKTACENDNNTNIFANNAIRTHRLCIMNSPFHVIAWFTFVFPDL